MVFQSWDEILDAGGAPDTVMVGYQGGMVGFQTGLGYQMHAGFQTWDDGY